VPIPEIRPETFGLECDNCVGKAQIWTNDDGSIRGACRSQAFGEELTDMLQPACVDP